VAAAFARVGEAAELPGISREPGWYREFELVPDLGRAFFWRSMFNAVSPKLNVKVLEDGILRFWKMNEVFK